MSNHRTNNTAPAPDESGRTPALRMQRGVSQLLFTYTPGRTVDWEDGRAIVQLGEVQLANVWPADKAMAVLDEASEFRTRWIESGGEFDDFFVDPSAHQQRFVVGTPTEVIAHYFNTILVCQQCDGIVRTGGGRELRCQQCGSEAVRQFGQVFVHGCGEIVAIRDTIPVTGGGDDGIHEVKLPLKCRTCNSDASLKVSARSERVKDFRITCSRCGVSIFENRIVARCHKCLARIRAAGSRGDNTVLGRIAMRMSRYSASDTYYPVSVTRLRLDRPQIAGTEHADIAALKKYLPRSRTTASLGQAAEVLAARIKLAEQQHDNAEKARLSAVLVELLTNPATEAAPANEGGIRLTPDLERAIEESVAFRATVTSTPALHIAEDGESRPLLDHIRHQLANLKISELTYVSDLPVITATLGYTRRAFQPFYDEPFAQHLPTRVRPFESVSRPAAAKLGRPDFVGRIPLLAREGEHEGLFFALNPEEVRKWLATNGITTGNGDARDAILRSLEPVDKYCDRIWECDTRRLVFGLVHSLSHALMCALSQFAGIDRTSIGEYIFLPLLGGVIYDSSTAFMLGGVQTLVRDHLSTFLAAGANDNCSCIYDPDCIDRDGACHGCLHAPEISCRFFNHGLSRAFLLGGHAPWVDVSDRQTIRGFWERPHG